MTVLSSQVVPNSQVVLKTGFHCISLVVPHLQAGKVSGRCNKYGHWKAAYAQSYFSHARRLHVTMYGSPSTIT